MTLPPGTRLGHYEIVSALGAGGMGEVYRARDTQLDRGVALKVLPDSFAADPDRLMRFTREARTLASLNHPNIAAIYGVVDRAPLDNARGAVSDSRTALVMELVEGPDLSELITGLPLSDALSIAKQIADALEAAHEAGIIHRDLKPANIKVRADGTVKVLDFGLAKAMDPPLPEASAGKPAFGTLDAGPTMTSPAVTAMGLILGTASYMSPEQARGKPVDKRADIWAFGVVLYEMLTGITLFAGETVSDVLAAVLRADIDLARLPGTVPPAIRQLLSRCLEKDARKRLRDIGEARVLLESPSALEPPALVSHHRTNHKWPWIMAASFVFVFATWLAIARPWASESSAPALHIRMQTGFVGKFDNSLQNLFAISADSAVLAFAVTEAAPVGTSGFEARSSLYIRRLDQATATPLPGTEGAHGPFFSPKGDWVGYFAKGKLFKIPVNGGAAVPVADAPLSRGATWGEDDVITFSPSAAPGAGLVRVSANGGTPTRLGAMVDKHATQRWPQALPGNQAILYTGAVNVDNFDDACLVVQTLDGAPPRVVQCGGSSWTYTNSGHILYAHAGSIFAAPFDIAKLTIIGTGVPLIDNVRSSVVSGAAQFAVARNGRLAYLADDKSGSGRSEAPIDIVDRQGKTTRLTAAPMNWLTMEFSPDGTRLALDVSTPTARSVWLYDLARGVSQRATFTDVAETRPIWMDDRHLTFASAAGGPPNLFNQAADGGKPVRLTESPQIQYPGSWSPDGKWLAFTEVRDGQGDVMVLPVEGDAKTGLKPGKAVPLLASSQRESHPAFSPDGKWIAFASNESSTLQVYVTSASDPTRRVPVSIDGGSQPMWSRSSRELLFRTEESASRIFFVTYDTSDGTFRPSRPALWTPVRFGLRSGIGDVSLHPDGRRIAGTVVTAEVDATPTEPLMYLITDFFAVLKGKVK